MSHRAMPYRVRISGEIVAAVGPRAVRRVAVPPEKPGTSPRILEFTRAWTELDELPGPVRGDLRLEIEVFEERSGDFAWVPVDRNAASDGEEAAAETEPPSEEAAVVRQALAAASYAELQQVAKAAGLKAHGTADELRTAVASVLITADGVAELPEALALLDIEK